MYSDEPENNPDASTLHTPVNPRKSRRQLSKLQEHCKCCIDCSGCRRGYTRCRCQARLPGTRPISTSDTGARCQRPDVTYGFVFAWSLPRVYTGLKSVDNNTHSSKNYLRAHPQLYTVVGYESGSSDPKEVVVIHTGSGPVRERSFRQGRLVPRCQVCPLKTA